METNGFEEVLKFFNGEVTLIYDAGLHAYYELVDYVKYLVPGSSTVCGVIDKSGALTQWAANTTVLYIRENVGKLTRYIDLDSIKGDFITKEDLEGLLNEARFNYRTIQKVAKDIGTIAHEWLLARVMDIIEGNPLAEVLIPPLPEDEKARNCVQAALKWMDIHKFKPLKAENKVFSREFGYAGTFDWIGYITSCGNVDCCPFKGTVKVLGDYKSSKDLYDEYRAQTASYQYAYNEELAYLDELNNTPPWEVKPLEGRVLLRLGKDDGEFEAKVMLSQLEFDKDMDGFLGALSVYNWMKQFQLDKKADKMEERAAKKAAKTAAKEARPARKRVVRRPVAPADELIPIGV